MTTTKGKEGTVRPTDTGFMLRFERSLDHPVQNVWDAITKEHADWLSGEGAELELRVGGKVTMPAHDIDGTVVELDPPRVLAFGWDSEQWGSGGTVRFELIPDGDGTRLVFTHDHPPIDQAQQDEFAKKMGWPDEMKRPVPRTLAGWHSLLDRLEQRLAQGAVSAMPTPEDPGDEWKQVFGYYLETVKE
jgi:uncharacterized protein YndB with AHSA1/START domain